MLQRKTHKKNNEMQSVSAVSKLKHLNFAQRLEKKSYGKFIGFPALYEKRKAKRKRLRHALMCEK